MEFSRLANSPDLREVLSTLEARPRPNSSPSPNDYRFGLLAMKMTHSPSLLKRRGYMNLVQPSCLHSSLFAGGSQASPIPS